MRCTTVTGLYESVLNISMTGLMWKPIQWVAVTTTKFLIGSAVGLKARSDLAQLTSLPLDNIWDVRKFRLVLPLLSISFLSRKVSSSLRGSRNNRSFKTSHLKANRVTELDGRDTKTSIPSLYICLFKPHQLEEKKPQKPPKPIHRARAEK